MFSRESSNNLRVNYYLPIGSFLKIMITESTLSEQIQSVANVKRHLSGLQSVLTLTIQLMNKPSTSSLSILVACCI